MLKFKPISISLSPNVEKDDVKLAFRLIFQPWKWKKGLSIAIFEDEFKKYFKTRHTLSFNSGRSSLLAILKALDLNSGSEVLLQAFTCNAAANPILWAGLSPVYVDCDERTFNIDTIDLRKKITKKAKVLIVQHTFGMPAEMDEIVEIAKENDLILIEDCAHSLGSSYKNKLVGTFGTAAFFSFSRDKIISSVYGGMVITSDDGLGLKIKEQQRMAAYPSCCWILQQLMHPVLMNYLVLPVYGFLSIGKVFLILLQKLHILSKAVHWKEKRGKMPCYFQKKMPNGLALLALQQFKKLERFNQHRKEIANLYFKNLKESFFKLPNSGDHVFLRFAVQHPMAHKIIKQAWDKNILIGDWYTSPIAPCDTKLDKVKYISGTCPKAEKLAKITLNLPTHINISYKQAGLIIEFLKAF